MKRIWALMAGLSMIVTVGFWGPSHLHADDYNSSEAIIPPSGESSSHNSDDNSSDPAQQKELTDAKKSLDSMSDLEELKPSSSASGKHATSKKIPHHAEAFVVGPDWEFDGFVAGGQDQNIKGMFAVNDLVYLNVGASHGFQSGDRIGIYRRGDKIRDPQTNRLMGYEVRKIAVSEVSDRIEDANCSARILKSFEAVEIGDLVRREE